MVQDVDLTDSVAESLILDLFAGEEPAHRDVIGAAVLEEHLMRGGRDPKFNHFSRFIGPVLGGLAKKGKAKFHAPNYKKGENAGDSRWEIFGTCR